MRNNYEYIPYYGYLKGPMMTYWDRMGNDADLSALTIVLLRESGYEANFVCGTMSIPPDELKSWLGVDEYLAVNKALNSGYIPYAPGNVVGAQLDIERWWVRAKINGVDVNFDPAFKRHKKQANRIDPAAAMQFNLNDLLDAAGGVEGDSGDSVKNINELALDKCCSFCFGSILVKFSTRNLCCRHFLSNM